MEFDLNKALVAKGDFVEKLVHFLPCSVHVKEAQNRKYRSCNQQNLALFDFKKQEELVGKTVNELDSFMKPFWGREYSQFVDMMDHKTITNKESTHDNNRVFLTSKGFVHIQDMTKVPILGVNNQVLAIFTVSNTITERADLITLYNYYKKIYQDKKNSVNFFLKHKKLDDCFFIPPTDAEIKVLLTMRINESHKIIANILNTETKTVETHVRHIRNKLKNIELSALISLLRNSNGIQH